MRIEHAPTCCHAQVDVLPLGDFNRDWAPHDRRHQDPVYVERVSLRDALQGGRPETLLGDVELVEPTFQVRCLPHNVLALPSQCWSPCCLPRHGRSCLCDRRTMLVGGRRM